MRGRKLGHWRVPRVVAMSLEYPKARSQDYDVDRSEILPHDMHERSLVTGLAHKLSRLTAPEIRVRNPKKQRTNSYLRNHFGHI